MYDVIVDVMPQIVAGDDQAHIMDKLGRTVSVTVGNMQPHFARPLGIWIPVETNTDNRFHVNVFSRAGIFSENLVVSWSNGSWHTDWELYRNGGKQRLHSIRPDFPFVSKPKT
jgi:hypothetical protein